MIYSEKETQIKYKAILKRYAIKDKEVAEMLGYASAQSWYTSHRKKRVVKGLVELVDRIEGKLKKQLGLTEK